MARWEYEDLFPDPEDDDPIAGFIFDGDEMISAEDWHETHSNPIGTEDCGDGYIDEDGCFVEY